VVWCGVVMGGVDSVDGMGVVWCGGNGRVCGGGQ
jgi:hypothetical protein